MEIVEIKDDFIKLGQAMKLAGISDTGVDAKIAVQDGQVKVNGETDLRRGRKLVDGDIVSYDGKEFQIKSRK